MVCVSWTGYLGVLAPDSVGNTHDGVRHFQCGLLGWPDGPSGALHDLCVRVREHLVDHGLQRSRQVRKDDALGLIVKWQVRDRAVPLPAMK
jgi:hypothetical protein